jgi:thiamine-phosphate pyrophosphorylase
VVLKDTFSFCGLYAITANHCGPHDLVQRVDAAIRGGARIVQYRTKNRDKASWQREGESLRELCQSAGVPLLINDDPELAQRSGADGVHLGQQDTSIQEARALLGQQAIIGISCHNSLELAQQAQRQGADYVAFGRFFPSATKPHASPAELTVLSRAKQCLTIPIVAIGGITPENGGLLIATGADMLAVIHGLFGQTDVTTAALRYRRLFEASPGT